VQLRNFKGHFTVQCQLSFVDRQKVAHITRDESQSAVGAARFQRDRGFGFQPNVKRPRTLWSHWPLQRHRYQETLRRIPSKDTPTFLPVYSSSAALTALETLTIIDFALSLNADNH
jgi:hypothetical protein